MREHTKKLVVWVITLIVLSSLLVALTYMLWQAFRLYDIYSAMSNIIYQASITGWTDSLVEYYSELKRVLSEQFANGSVYNHWLYISGATWYLEIIRFSVIVCQVLMFLLDIFFIVKVWELNYGTIKGSILRKKNTINY